LGGIAAPLPYQIHGAAATNQGGAQRRTAPTPAEAGAEAVHVDFETA
jgi:hypothetical protein